MTLPLAIWTTGDPVTEAARRRGRFFKMIRSGVGDGYPGGYLDVNCCVDSQFPAATEVSGIVVSGSPARLGDAEAWMLRTEEALRQAHAVGVPILGICFGHQLLGEALGGRVAPNPRGREIGTPVMQRIVADPLLDAVEAEPVVVMTHLDSIVELPPGTTILGSTELEPHAAVRFSESCWGVQFHPEMDDEIIGYYLEARRDDIQAEGIDVDAILSGRTMSEYGGQLLRAFGEFCRTRAVRA